MMKIMHILGIDPGTTITGYAIINYHPKKSTIIDYGAIRPPPKERLYKRYLIIYEAISSLLKIHTPDVLSIENQFMGKNPASMLKLGMAKGMAILAAEKRGIPIYEYPPKKVKQSIGYGNASKEQMQRMIQVLFDLPSLPTPADAADALALALCHGNSLSLEQCLTPSSAR